MAGAMSSDTASQVGQSCPGAGVGQVGQQPLKGVVPVPAAPADEVAAIDSALAAALSGPFRAYAHASLGGRRLMGDVVPLHRPPEPPDNHPGALTHADIYLCQLACEMLARLQPGRAEMLRVIGARLGRYAEEVGEFLAIDDNDHGDGGDAA